MEWEPSPDELAGVTELFGGLTRAELERALVELAFKRGVDATPEAFDSTVRAAVEEYYLLAVPRDGAPLLVAGPVAFPSLPDGAADLPHILDVPERTVSPQARADRVAKRLAADAEHAIDDGDAERAASLLEVSYDAEAWASVELDDVRDRLEAAL